MNVEELGDRLFVDPVQSQASAAHPTREMRDAGNVARNCVRGVPALGQVQLERFNVRADRPVSKPVDVLAQRTVNDAHGGLQKWDHQCNW